jgi:hypothetical protein
MTGLSNIEPCENRNGDVIDGTAALERRPWRTCSKADFFNIQRPRAPYPEAFPPA